MKALNFILIITLLSLTYCLYSSNSDVVVLTTKNFQKEVVDSKDIWLVEFYAPWCGHCQRLTPEWEKAAKALKGIIKIGAVDMDIEKSLGAPYNIQGFPTLKFFGSDKKKPSDYNNERTADAIVKYALDQAKEIALGRLNGKKSSENTKKSSSSSDNNKKGSNASDKDVVILTDDNFDEIIMNSKDMWLVEFYAPWCGHCKNLEPHWNEASTELKGKVKLAKLDSTVHTKTSGKYGVRGYPTIKIFAPGQKTSNSVSEWDGPREANGIVSVALEKLEKFGFFPDVEQLTNQSQLKEVCQDRAGVCILTFLPNINDDTKEQRKKYLDELNTANKGSSGKPIYFLWVQGADFLELEDKLSLGFGYPAVVAVSFNKKKFSVNRSAFGADNIKSFVTSK